MNLMHRTLLQALFAAAFFFSVANNTHAGEADVVNVTIESLGEGKFRVNATL